jgi:hypothetical protein
MKTNPAFAVDVNFLSQVYYWVWMGQAIGTFTLGILYGFPSAVSFTIGGFISLSMLALIELAVRRTVAPKNSVKKAKWLFATLTLSKYIGLTVLLFLLIRRTEWLNVYALTAGITLVQLVIIAKAIVIATQFLLLKGAHGSR